jgi:hypothetical protein
MERERSSIVTMAREGRGDRYYGAKRKGIGTMVGEKIWGKVLWGEREVP